MLKVETGKAKANFSAVKKQAQTQDVAITNHGKVEAYLVSPERYDRFLAVADTAPDAIAQLENEWRRRIADMNTPEKRKLLREMKTKSLEEILAGGALADEQPTPRRKAVASAPRKAATRP